MANENDKLNFDVDTIFVPMEDGTEQEYAILDEFDLEGKNYMILSAIEDDEEFERGSAYYESLMEEEMEGESLGQ